MPEDPEESEEDQLSMLKQLQSFHLYEAIHNRCGQNNSHRRNGGRVWRLSMEKRICDGTYFRLLFGGPTRLGSSFKQEINDPRVYRLE